ncbi:hypothetical protein [Vibrio vulnificus]|nr:hypothetical protein [Vibrio vulnificus]
MEITKNELEKAVSDFFGIDYSDNAPSQAWEDRCEGGSEGWDG